MNAEKYYPPELILEQFHCPFCNVYSKQFWAHLYAIKNYNGASLIDKCAKFEGELPKKWALSKCQHCGNVMIWYDTTIIHPKVKIVQNPNSDLNEDIQNDYNEAAKIFNDSPRAAAAILRLALQKLCIQLGESGKNINEDIKSLVAKGLNPLVQKSLDSLRITGNNAVHPGEINLKDEPDRVLKLFDLINFIANKLITEPKEIEQFYNALPESARESVAKRDKAPGL